MEIAVHADLIAVWKKEKKKIGQKVLQCSLSSFNQADDESST